MYVSRISSLPEDPDVPISSLNVNISQFFDMGRKNGKNGKYKLKFALIPRKKSTFDGREMYFWSKITLEINHFRADIVLLKG